MDPFLKYVNPGPEDRLWGLFLNCAGKASIAPGVVYPPASHPSGYYFTFEKGRVLSEYQINYITEGTGTYEDATGKYRVGPGTLMFIRPGIWHRYRPRKSTGWTEHYVGFNGPIAVQLYEKQWFAEQRPVLKAGYREEIIDAYYRIFEYVIGEKPGYQQVSAGMVMKLLGYIVSLDRQKNFSGKRIEQIIQNACFTIREQVDSKFDFQAFAASHHIGYSYFRKMFKKYTGVSPLNYHMELKLLRAKEMLLNTDLSVKEIGFGLGFHSIHYFSRMFKMKTGFSPTEMRRSVER